MAASWLSKLSSAVEPFGVEVLTSARILNNKSKDYYWYSPVLRSALEQKQADCVVEVRSEEQLLATVKSCAHLKIPCIARGAGTGNYGQAVPLTGGVVLDVNGLQGWTHCKSSGIVTAAAGQNMEKLEKGLSADARELRLFPSTIGMSTIGGFIAGGSTGVGGITYGVLKDRGNVTRLRLVTMEEDPRVLDLKGDDVAPALHAYGTNGIITEVSMPTAPLQHWHEAIAAFDDVGAATRAGVALGEAPAIVKRNCCMLAAPITTLPGFTRMLPSADGSMAMKEAAAVNLLTVAESSLEAATSLMQEHGGRILWSRSMRDGSRRRPLYEFGWNHTTLRALRKDPNITYLQCGFMPGTCAEDVVKVFKDFCGSANDHEMMMHLEFMNLGGRIGAFGIPLLQYRSEQRLNEIITKLEGMGVPNFNPHTFVLEDGGMKQTDYAQLEFKKQNDPNGLLNQGKMRAFEEGQPNYDPDTLGFDKIRAGHATATGAVKLSAENIETLVAQSHDYLEE